MSSREPWTRVVVQSVLSRSIGHQYGTQAWDDHWSLLTGDGELTWGPDPHLTPVGEGQAREACSMWKALLDSKAVSDPPPLPTLFFSSPLIRSAKTLELTFQGLVSKEQGFTPTILECVREDFKDRHTCDQRSSRTVISSVWAPLGWHIDAGVDEEDTLFQVRSVHTMCLPSIDLSHPFPPFHLTQSEYRESREVMTERLEDALSLIFERSKGHDVVNLTSHSGAMQALFRAVQHVDFKPKTGGELTVQASYREKQSLTRLFITRHGAAAD